MIKIENIEVMGWDPAIRGMRNPMNSWNKSDSVWRGECFYHNGMPIIEIGPNDLDLMERLAAGGSTHAKYRRMIVCYMDVTAPLYWWKEADTYKVGTVANSCSTMHKIHSKPIEINDFSIDDFHILTEGIYMTDCFTNVVADCEMLRQKYLETKEKKYWRALIQLLPCSYNQKRTLMLNYEVLSHIYHDRKDHKLTEWREFCQIIKALPDSHIITMEERE